MSKFVVKISRQVLTRIFFKIRLLIDRNFRLKLLAARSCETFHCEAALLNGEKVENFLRGMLNEK